MIGPLYPLGNWGGVFVGLGEGTQDFAGSLQLQNLELRSLGRQFLKSTIHKCPQSTFCSKIVVARMMSISFLFSDVRWLLLRSFVQFGGSWGCEVLCDWAPVFSECHHAEESRARFCFTELFAVQSLFLVMWSVDRCFGLCGSQYPNHPPLFFPLKLIF